MKLEMVFGGVFKCTEQSSSEFGQPSLPSVRRLPASVQACLYGLSSIVLPRFYSMHGTLRYIRGRPSSPRAAFALGGVASSHQPHKRAGSSWSRLNGSPGRTVRRSSTICVDGSGPRVSQNRTRHLRTFEASRPASSRGRMGPQPAEDLPISPPGRASASSGGGPPWPWRVWAPTAGG